MFCGHTHEETQEIFFMGPFGMPDVKNIKQLKHDLEPRKQKYQWIID